MDRKITFKYSLEKDVENFLRMDKMFGINPQHHDLRIQVKQMKGMDKSIKDIFLTLANSNLL
ncbi:MAG: hypothetical protein A2544_01620 [Candidatus Zambryskibacteria bacterium RIFOXYD2_FULL_43_10]|uniref:Uncharacterized protein n=1 Tax=Candidatus Zambryskibacteria bacterium RIFOXYD2_FULL_43_10 TaxID=1802782 RepID=A0A1G2V6M5_9BACT|nr:MAG: hypothetical protein A2544_01620 [Candidatus Zambryskibacteria bacterium RIFOXYD2_FULL_43_10]